MKPFFTISRLVLCSILAILLSVFTINAQNKNIENGKQYDKLIIRNVNVIDGKGTPMRGPSDIIIEGNKIASITRVQDDEKYKSESNIIDGSGMYVLPGLINNHGHIHYRKDCPVDYVFKLWLSCGITTVRDVGSDRSKTYADRRNSKDGKLAAPRIYIYAVVWSKDPEDARDQVRKHKQEGADGIKLFGLDRDVMAAAMDEANKLGLRVAHHVGVEETDAWDDIQFGTTTIEHWYGIPEAALEGSQNFPSSYNYSNESDRFRYAGRLWREANPEKLKLVLKGMVENNVAWVPTFVIYEANRDLQRARNQPWFKDYLHPVLEQYFVPNPENHGSYQWNWSTTDEIFWKENYQIWMNAAHEFAKIGGNLGVGEDAGYIYMMYGFSLIRELELHQEAGFHPIDVIMHATSTNAKILGIENEVGRIREGYLADLIIVEGNPLENLKFLYPTGVMDLENGKIIQRGGIKYTIKDGIVYDAKQMLNDVKEMVEDARMDREVME